MAEARDARDTVLLVDDEREVVELIRCVLVRAGYRVLEAGDVPSALHLLDTQTVHAVVTDIRMPGLTGFDLLRRVRNQPGPYIPVLLITGFAGDSAGVLEGLRAGADDFMWKPVDQAELVARVKARIRASRWTGVAPAEAVRPADVQSRSVDGTASLGMLAETVSSPVRTPSLAQLFDLLHRIADSTASVLFTGETGTGKGGFARYLHSIGPRWKAPFVPVHCAIFPSELVAAELFGHERGAFTGARERRVGRCEAADGGTLFLDEVGDLPASVQVALLRFCQSGEFERLGDGTTRRTNVRLVTATNRNLSRAMDTGGFRADLFYRLSVFVIEVPPLRTRPEDVPILTHHFLNLLASREKKPVVEVESAALKLLQEYTWPGNVRELQNVVERAFILTRGSRITTAEIVLGTRGAVRSGSAPMSGSVGATPVGLQDRLLEIERRQLVDALNATGGNRSQAARLLRLPRTTFLTKLRRHGLED